MRQRPLFVLTLGFALGLLGQSQRPVAPLYLALSCGILVTLSLLTFQRLKSFSHVCLLASVVLGGMLWWEWQAQRAPDDVSYLLPRVGGHFASVEGVVSSEPEERDARQRFSLEASRVQSGALNAAVTGKLMTYAPAEVRLETGDRVKILARLRAPAEAGNPGQFSLRRYLERQGCYATATVERVQDVQKMGDAPRLSLAAWSARARKRILTTYEQTMPQPYAALTARLLGSVVYGVRASPLPREVEEPFRRAGAFHVLVASGTQVAVLAGVLFLLTRRSYRLRWGVFFLVLPVLIAYALLAGAAASILRATLVGVLAVAAFAFVRDFDSFTALAIAALGVLIPRPAALYDVGAQLSYAAVGGILLGARPLHERWLRWLPRWAGLSLSVSLSAQLATMPLIAHYFGKVYWVGIVSNVVIVPLTGVLVCTGLISCVLGFVWTPLAQAVNFFNYHLTLGLLSLTRLFAQLPYADVTFYQPPGWMLVIYFGVVIGAVTMPFQKLREKLTREWLLVGMLVTAAGAVVCLTVRSAHLTLSVTVLDAGEGDCIFVRAPNGRTMLIDGGTHESREPLAGVPRRDVGERVILPFLLTQGVRRLDVIVLTHPHDDHVNGLATVVRTLSVGRILDGAQKCSEPSYERFLFAAQQKQIPLVRARRGQVINLGGGVKVYVLTPIEPLMQGSRSDLNNNSVAIKITYRRVSFLLAGDMEREAERRLLLRGDNLRSDVLKVAHHGSETSSTPEFLRAVRPRIAIISCGERNPFQHPSRETLQRLRRVGAQVYRTDVHGAVTVQTDGRTCWVEMFRE
jgi:competence protein ComEC